MAIKVVSFDVNGTLLNCNEFIDKFWYQEIPRLYSEKYGVSFSEALNRIKRDYNLVGPNDLRWYLPNYWFMLYGFDQTPEEILMKLIPRVNIGIIDGADKVVEKLAEKYVLIAISSQSIEFLKAEAYHIKFFQNFLELFSAPSHFKATCKTPNLYRKVCEILSIKPVEIIHIGDDPTYDYEMANKAGIRAEALGKTIRNLHELIRIL